MEDMAAKIAVMVAKIGVNKGTFLGLKSRVLHQPVCLFFFLLT